MRVMNNVMKPTLVQRRARLHLYKTLAQPILCYRSEAWAIRKQDINRITDCGMKSMQRTVGYSKWDHKRNEDILN